MSHKTQAAFGARTAIDAVVQTESIDRPQLSPDGEWVLFSQRRGVVSTNEHRYSLRAMPIAGGADPIALLEADPTSELFKVLEAEWSPDASRVAVLADSRVHVVAVPTGERIVIDHAEGGELSSLTWSPDGKRLAFVHQPSIGDVHFDSAVPIDLEKVFFRNVVENTVLQAQLPEPARQLWVATVDGGTAEFVGELPPGQRGIHWVDGQPRPGQAPGTPRGLVDPGGAWLAQPSGADWFCPPAITEWTSDIGERPRPPSSGDTLRTARMAWASDGTLLFTSEWRMARHLFRIKPGGEPERLTPEGFHYDAFSAQGGQVAFVRENPVEPANLLVMPEDELLSGKFEPRQLTQVPSATAPGLRLSRRSWVTEGGTEIEGFLVLPPADSVEPPFPTIVDIHGGPTMVRMQQWSHFPNALFASQGYAVFVPGSRGRFGGYDKDFCHHIETTGFQLRDPLIDVLAGVDALVREGIVDPDRVGVTGHSYGAVLTAYAITQTDRFRAASFHEGMVDQFRLLRLYGGSPGSLAAMKHITGYGSPYDAAEAARIRQESPIDNMHTARVPTLIEAGEESLAYDALLLAHALAHHGVPYEININPRTKHVVFEPRLFAEAIDRNLAWFDYWLRDRSYPNADKQAGFDAWKAGQPAPADGSQ